MLKEYERQCVTSDEVIAAHRLDETGRHPDFEVSAASLRWMLFHMIEETARHAGHLDAVCEFLDGGTGYY
ncbi:mycothiol transferase [Streptomyces sp. WMMC1477]|uniref:mycothiol transferase n=1 Tax=Streptomyces sp. WMMC1477 TaxID=3015155 RepID=UPI003FCE3D4A